MMFDNDSRFVPSLVLWSVIAVMMVLVGQPGGAQRRTAAPEGTDWPMYRHDLAGTGYSPLTQINAVNVATLAPAWTLSLQSDAPPAAGAPGRGGAAAVN